MKLRIPWNELLHPRDHLGRFTEKMNKIEFFDRAMKSEKGQAWIEEHQGAFDVDDWDALASSISRLRPEALEIDFDDVLNQVYGDKLRPRERVFTPVASTTPFPEVKAPGKIGTEDTYRDNVIDFALVTRDWITNRTGRESGLSAVTVNDNMLNVLGVSAGTTDIFSGHVDFASAVTVLPRARYTVLHEMLHTLTAKTIMDDLGVDPIEAHLDPETAKEFGSRNAAQASESMKLGAVKDPLEEALTDTLTRFYLNDFLDETGASDYEKQMNFMSAGSHPYTPFVANLLTFAGSIGIDDGLGLEKFLNDIHGTSPSDRRQKMLGYLRSAISGGRLREVDPEAMYGVASQMNEGTLSQRYESIMATRSLSLDSQKESWDTKTKAVFKSLHDYVDVPNVSSDGDWTNRDVTKWAYGSENNADRFESQVQFWSGMSEAKNDRDIAIALAGSKFRWPVEWQQRELTVQVDDISPRQLISAEAAETLPFPETLRGQRITPETLNGVVTATADWLRAVTGMGTTKDPDDPVTFGEMPIVRDGAAIAGTNYINGNQDYSPEVLIEDVDPYGEKDRQSKLVASILHENVHGISHKRMHDKHSDILPFPFSDGMTKESVVSDLLARNVDVSRGTRVLMALTDNMALEEAVVDANTRLYLASFIRWMRDEGEIEGIDEAAVSNAALRNHPYVSLVSDLSFFADMVGISTESDKEEFFRKMLATPIDERRRYLGSLIARMAVQGRIVEPPIRTIEEVRTGVRNGRPQTVAQQLRLNGPDSRYSDQEVLGALWLWAVGTEEFKPFSETMLPGLLLNPLAWQEIIQQYQRNPEVSVVVDAAIEEAMYLAEMEDHH